jgi:hypothetical protein
MHPVVIETKRSRFDIAPSSIGALFSGRKMTVNLKVFLVADVVHIALTCGSVLPIDASHQG